ncbi:putative zinc-binding protein [Desulfosediminicola sp.]|uniref:putative zinc-binding protein n=1 Tax=Desulfosediminicola sp. TaxID=2886825 RepID=UPI003AF252A8
MSTPQTDCKCSCSTSTGIAPKLVYACSGSADVGELSDRVARELSREGHGKMSCLAGIGGRVTGLLKSAEAASGILAIDGCKLHCGLKSMQEAGFSQVRHLCLDDLGYTKGATEITESAIHQVAQHAASMLSSK